MKVSRPCQLPQMSVANPQGGALAQWMRLTLNALLELMRLAEVNDAAVTPLARGADRCARPGGTGQPTGPDAPPHPSIFALRRSGSGNTFWVRAPGAGVSPNVYRSVLDVCSRKVLPRGTRCFSL